MNTQPSYDKLLDPIDDISTSIEALLDGSFGRLMGDQRESLKRIYSACWGLHTLFLDVITSIGIENIAQRTGLEEHFQIHILPIRENARSLLNGEDGPLSEEQEICLEYIHDIGIVLQGYVDKLWLFSRMENKLLEAEKQDFLLKDFLLEHQWLQGKSDFHLDMVIPDEAIRLKADKKLLEAALRMLFENAFHASDTAGLIRLHLDAKETELLIHFEDEGRGIPLVHHEAVFDPFFQINKINVGLGLGLYLVRGIFDLHGASIEVDKAYEKGAAFQIRIPLDK
jgi:K+-sensing histidine kinase KdpD